MPTQLTECNCSICRRYGPLWAYYPPDEVRILVGADGEQCYVWGDGELEFVRCARCGCITHYRVRTGLPEPRIALNFRMAAEGWDRDIPRRYFDGASR